MPFTFTEINLCPVEVRYVAISKIHHQGKMTISNLLILRNSFFQVNCIQQLENISSYAFMKDKLSKKEVHLHAVWFHLDTASVFMLCRDREEFIEVNEENYDILLKEAEG